MSVKLAHRIDIDHIDIMIRQIIIIDRNDCDAIDVACWDSAVHLYIYPENPAAAVWDKLVTPHLFHESDDQVPQIRSEVRESAGLDEDTVNRDTCSSIFLLGK